MTKEQPKGIDALQAKQDKEFWKKLEGCCFMEGEFTDMEEVIHINSSIDKMCVESHISKIREETLQAVREEIEKTKWRVSYPDGKLADTTRAKNYNQALDDLLKSLDI